MKTNHQRGFKARKETTDTEAKHYFTQELPLSGEQIHNYLHNVNHHNGQARKARKGAKQHMNSVARQRENDATKRLVDDQDNE